MLSNQTCYWGVVPPSMKNKEGEKERMEGKGCRLLGQTVVSCFGNVWSAWCIVRGSHITLLVFI